VLTSTKHLADRPRCDTANNQVFPVVKAMLKDRFIFLLKGLNAMKRILRFYAIVGAVLWLLVSQMPAYAYYSTVDTLHLTTLTGMEEYLSGDARYLRQDFSVTNVGAADLKDVGFLWKFIYAGGAFQYDSSSHRWGRQMLVDEPGQGVVDYGMHWLEVYTYDPIANPLGQTDYFSMARTLTDSSLTYAFGETETDLLSASDEIPVFWLGDMATGDSVDFTFYALQGPYPSPVTGDGWPFYSIYDTVAETAPVPIPGAAFLMGSGLAALGLLRRFRHHG
jgi:hypothetical protein